MIQLFSPPKKELPPELSTVPRQKFVGNQFGKRSCYFLTLLCRNWALVLQAWTAFLLRLHWLPSHPPSLFFLDWRALGLIILNALIHKSIHEYKRAIYFVRCHWHLRCGSGKAPKTHFQGYVFIRVLTDLLKTSIHSYNYFLRHFWLHWSLLVADSVLVIIALFKKKKGGGISISPSFEQYHAHSWLDGGSPSLWAKGNALSPSRAKAISC